MNCYESLDKNICTLEELNSRLKLSGKEKVALKEVIKFHPMSITKYYLSLIDPLDKGDPLRKLVVPSLAELDLAGSYDTSGEAKNTKTVGLQHKYAQTALLLTTNQCAAYCRFCFRKRLVGLPSKEILKNFESAALYIEAHKEINNVLLSGGDPLILTTNILSKVLSRLSKIKHLDFIRIGTRMPVVFPDRIIKDKALLRLFKRHSRKTRRIFIVTHFNHPREITNKAIEVIDALINSNLIVDNQTVLLKGVNDRPKVLVELMRKLVSIGANPYYLFQCRPVKCVKNSFQVPFPKACNIVDEARKHLDGHSKRFKYVLSHETGKIEILGILGKEILFKQHQAKKPSEIGKIFKRKVGKGSAWLDHNLQPI